MCQRVGTPNTPANPFHAGGEFRGFHGSLICYGLPGCSAPCTDLTSFPAIGAFYFQASNEIGPLLDMTTASTGLLCWRDFHPQEWQLDSLHGTRPLDLVCGVEQRAGARVEECASKPREGIAANVVAGSRVASREDHPLGIELEGRYLRGTEETIIAFERPGVVRWRQ